MEIHKAKSSSYNSVDSKSIYDYIRLYANDIYNAVEPKEDDTGNAYKAMQECFLNCDRTQLKAIAAELETVKKRFDYILHGRY